MISTPYVRPLDVALRLAVAGMTPALAILTAVRILRALAAT